MVSKITFCRVCQHGAILEILDLGKQALSGVFPSSGDIGPESGPLEIGVCENCELVQLLHSYPSDLMYGDNYGYRSGLNSSMARHLHLKANRVYGKYVKANQPVILDIGSNDGTLLNSLKSTGARLIGIDPTSAKFAEYYDSSILKVPKFFSEEVFREISTPADLIFSIAMFYDLENPVEFVKQIARCLQPEGVWHFEQSYLISMMDTNSFDTICHEHVEYYSFAVIEKILLRADMRVVDVELNDTNGGSIAITATKINSTHVETFYVEWLRGYEKAKVSNIVQGLKEFAAQVVSQREIIRDLLISAKNKGMDVWAVGASTKGNTLLQYCNLDSQIITAIAEINPFKFGRFTPGTAIPIKSEIEMLEAMPDLAIVLPWHFKPSIIKGNENYLNRGGKLIFPLPYIEIIT